MLLYCVTLYQNKSFIHKLNEICNWVRMCLAAGSTVDVRSEEMAPLSTVGINEGWSPSKLSHI